MTHRFRSRTGLALVAAVIASVEPCARGQIERPARAPGAPTKQTPTRGKPAPGQSPDREKGSNAKADEAGAMAEALLDRLASEPSGGDFAGALGELTRLFLYQIGTVPPEKPGAYVAMALRWRLVDQLGKADKAYRQSLLSFLRERPELARAVAFAVRPADEDPAKVYGLLQRLVEARGKALEPMANLTAAVCVVHDRTLERRINENTARAPDAIEVFDHFANNAGVLPMPVRTMPPELLIYVVDACASPAELAWSLKTYGKDRNVGKRFSDIMYDYNHLLKGLPKQSTVHGWSLESILRHGGVCADQAYFASTTAKAQGIPAAYVVGVAAGGGHAWVGFLDASRKNTWNFESGRFGDYVSLRGSLEDPQTGRTIADSDVSIVGGLLGEKASDRYEAMALLDAAERLREAGPGFSLPPAVEGLEAPVQPTGVHDASMASQLDLIETALRKTPSLVRGWELVARRCEKGLLSSSDKARWASALDNLCGKSYPDFSLRMLTAMIASVPDASEQDAMWSRAMTQFRSRPDLASEVRIRQGIAWEKAGEKAKAWGCYQEVLKQYANASAWAVEAAEACERLLESAGKSSEIPGMYGDAWGRIPKPLDVSPEFMRGSAWFRMGTRYVVALEKAGRDAEATKARAQLGVK